MEQEMINALIAQRNNALNEAAQLQAQANIMAQSINAKNDEIERLKQELEDNKTAADTPPPDRGSKAHLNEAANGKG